MTWTPLMLLSTPLPIAIFGGAALVICGHDLLVHHALNLLELELTLVMASHGRIVDT